MRRLACVLALLAGLAAGATEHVWIAHTNDIHGALLESEAWWMSRDFPPPLGNAASAVWLIDDLRRQAADSGYGFVVLDAGDVYKGSPVGDDTRGMAVVEYFNRAGYDAIGVGEFDYADGLGALRDMTRAADMPFLNANIRTADGDTTPGFLKPRVILDRRGVKLGIFGLVTSYNNESIEDSAVGNMVVENERDVAREEVERLRRDGADIVIGLTHIGHRYEARLAEDVTGIDVIIGGRSNTALYEPVETPKHHTIVTQAASRLTAVGFLDLEIDAETKRIVGYQGRLVNLYAEEMPRDPGFAAYLDSLRREAEAGFDEVVGYCRRTLTREDMRESPAGNLVTDAMREFAGADIALHNSSGIRKDIPEGEVTYRDCYEIDAFGNTMVSGEYTGRQVREMLELSVNERYWILQVSGLTMTYDPGRPFGAKVREVLVGGTPLDPDARYRVVTNSYLGGDEGTYAVFQEGENVADTNVPLRDAIAEYFRRHSPVDARVEGRIKTVQP